MVKPRLSAPIWRRSRGRTNIKMLLGFLRKSRVRTLALIVLVGMLTVTLTKFQKWHSKHIPPRDGNILDNILSLQLEGSNSGGILGGGNANKNKNAGIRPQSLSQPIEDSNNMLPRVLAFVFPQFHEATLNNYLWGKGFTDWDNLKKSPAKNRLGFDIPRPTELGFYNYADLEPRKKQGELGRTYGIDGFVFHHYWFYDETHPGPDLQTPLTNMLSDGHPDLPFALHWCASKWTNTWSGQVGPEFKFKEPNVLQKQYFPEDDKDGKITEHYNWLKQFFHHPNYIKVDGKPILMMYQKKPSSFPVLKILREMAVSDGFPGLYITVGLTKPHDDLLDIGDHSKYKSKPQKAAVAFSKFDFDKVVSYPNPAEWNANRSLDIPAWCRRGENENESLSKSNSKPKHNRLRDIAGIISSFDNTPRRNYEEANLWSSSPPNVVIDRFRNSLHASIYYESCCFPNDDRSTKKKDDDDRFIIINAMNEWAEGMALEPSDVYGRQFLESIRDTKSEILKSGCNNIDIAH